MELAASAVILRASSRRTWSRCPERTELAMRFPLSGSRRRPYSGFACPLAASARRSRPTRTSFRRGKPRALIGHGGHSLRSSRPEVNPSPGGDIRCASPVRRSGLSVVERRSLAERRPPLPRIPKSFINFFSCSKINFLFRSKVKKKMKNS